MNESEEFSTIDDTAIKKSKQPIEPVTEPAIEAGSSKQGITPTGLFLVMLTIAVFGIIVWFIVSIWTTPDQMSENNEGATQVESINTNETSIPGRDPEVLGLRIDTQLGRFFTERSTGLTLYVTKEECFPNCPGDWNPYVSQFPRPPGALSTQPIDSEGLYHQYTWDGKRLYLFTADSEPGDALGAGYDGIWQIARP